MRLAGLAVFAALLACSTECWAEAKPESAETYDIQSYNGVTREWRILATIDGRRSILVLVCQSTHSEALGWKGNEDTCFFPIGKRLHANRLGLYRGEYLDAFRMGADSLIFIMGEGRARTTQRFFVKSESAVIGQ